MHRLLLLALICGCEQIEPSGNPLQPAQVAAVAPTAVPVHVVDGAAAIEDSEETFSLSSEEMAPGAPAEVVEEGADTTQPSADVTPVAKATDDVAPTASASTPVRCLEVVVLLAKVRCGSCQAPSSPSRVAWTSP